MEKGNFIQRLAKASGHDMAAAAELSDILTGLLASALADCNTVAIPGFGTFTHTKTDEYVATDPEGHRMLMPPAITAGFTPGSKLRKSCMPHTSQTK